MASMYQVIQKKRDGGELTDGEIRYVINGFTAGDIPDYQMSAFAMAVYFCGMNDREISTLTDAMAKSGDSVDLSCFGKLSADKHSTGGVGDKTSLIVAPIAASLGCKVAKMSGRGLGHTGGTVDKLESIKGYKTTLTAEEFLNQTRQVGIALTGQSGNLAPADKKLYALRDVTATVESLPLIASSIMSKKLAAGAKNIVLDVKCGSGAFMKTAEDAEKLAQCMVNIGKRCGRNMRALITNMDIPLGNSVGNSLEVIEAIEILRGGGDAALREICCALASSMASMALDIEPDKADSMAHAALSSGKAFDTFRAWIGAQGGDMSWIDNPDNFPKAKYKHTVYSPQDGFISYMNTQEVGACCVLLGGGRKVKDDVIDYSAGIIMSKKTGDAVKKGEALATLYTENESAFEEAKQCYLNALEFSDLAPEKKKLIYKYID